MALDRLTELVNVGVAAVEDAGGYWKITGAVGNDPALVAELTGAGTARMSVDSDNVPQSVMFAPRRGIQSELDALQRKTKANAAALKVRNKRIKIDGVREFDKQRAQALRQNGAALKDVYKKAIDDVQGQLDAIAAIDSAQLEPEEAIQFAYRRGQLDEMLDQLGEGLASAGTQAEDLATAQLTQAAAIGSDVATWTISNVTGKQLARFLGTDFAQLAVHNKYDKIAWGNITNKAKAVQMLRREVGKGVLLGEHPTKIAQRLRGTFNQWRNRSVTIARTETARVMTQAAQERYAAAEAEGIEIQNAWVATLDGRTRSSHRSVDGEVRDVGEKFSNGLVRPGTGSAAEAINCRCCLMPVVNGYLPAYRLDNETGEAIPWQSYNEWAKKSGAHTTTARAVPSKGIDAAADVYKNVGKKYRKKLDDILQTADSKARSVYKKFESRFKLDNGSYRGGAHYSWGAGVSLNLSKTYDDTRGSMVTWFHEFGHMTDYIANPNSYKYFSIEYKGGLFGATLKKEVNSYVNATHKRIKQLIKSKDWDELHRMGAISDMAYSSIVDPSFPQSTKDFYISQAGKKAHAYMAVSNEIMALTDAQQADLSDIFEGATGGRASGKWGHGKSYWKKKDKAMGADSGLSAEAFAEFMSAYISNPESLEVLRKYLPESGKVFDEMLEELLEGEV